MRRRNKPTDPWLYQDDSWTGRAVARTTDPETSHQAAAEAEISLTKTRILTILNDNPNGLTDEWIIAEFARRNWPTTPSGCRGRRADLVALGLVVDSGLRGVTATGRECIVWRAVSVRH